MPNDASTHAESDATTEAFDAMWAPATRAETLTKIVINRPGGNFRLDGLTLSRVDHTNETTEITPLVPSMTAPDTTASAARAVGTTNVIAQPA